MGLSAREVGIGRLHIAHVIIPGTKPPGNKTPLFFPGAHALEAHVLMLPPSTHPLVPLLPLALK